MSRHLRRGKDKSTLWLPPVDMETLHRGSTVDEAMELYDIDEARYIEGKKHESVEGKMVKSNVRKVMREHAQTGGEFAYFQVPKDFVGKPLRQKMKESRKPGLRRAMNACRAIKDEHEIALIRKANAISAESHLTLLKRVHGLTSESNLAVEAILMQTAMANEYSCARPLYNKDLPTHQLLLIDASSEYHCYASNVTRTIPINAKNPGHWQSEEAAAVYKAVERIQAECVKQLRPGKKFIHVAWHAAHMAIDALLDLGILKGEHMEIFHAGTLLAFFPHGLGRHSGLKMNDANTPAKQEKTQTQNQKKSQKNNHEQGKKPQSPPSKHELKPAAKQEPNEKGPDTTKKDPRFATIQRAYRSYLTSTPNPAAYTPLMLSSDPKNYSLNPSLCLAPNTVHASPLKAGMVVTVAVGFEFKKDVLDDPKQAKFVDGEVLERFLGFGGGGGGGGCFDY